MINYMQLIDLINAEETGIAKGYSVCHLQREIRSKESFESLMKRDLMLFKNIQQDLLETKEPREGEFVEYEDGQFARISNLRGQLQLSNSIGVYVSEGGCSKASGCTWDPNLDHIEKSRLAVENLMPISETRKGRCWTFSEANAGGDRGVYFEIDFKIWKLKK
jgi:hypothetical protein